MGTVVRVGLVVLGIGIMVTGLAAIVAVPEIGAGGVAWVGMGGAMVVAVALERQRYRSQSAELSNAVAGPGGGEVADAPLEPRFRPTSEVFIDPTTGRRMRVLVDPGTGERRYVAEA